MYTMWFVVSPDRTALSDVTVLPCDDDTSLFVQWTSLATSAGITGYVVEWRPLLNTDPSLILFDLADRNQSSLVITGISQYVTVYRIIIGCYPANILISRLLV